MAEATRGAATRLPYVEPVCYTQSLQPAGGNNSVVECDLAKVEVAGSNPVSRSSLRLHEALQPTLLIAVSSAAGCPRGIMSRGTFGPAIRRQFRSAPSPSGKAEVCKTSIPGSNPGGASNFS